MKNSILLTLCAVLPLALSAPTPASHLLSARETDEEATDRLLFDTSIADFQTARDAQDPATLDWSSDGCSSSPDQPGFNFLPSCYRHDFGYRNYKDQDRFDDAGKDSIDSNFKADLYDECETEHGDDIDACKNIADIYYWAVSNIGSKEE